MRLAAIDIGSNSIHMVITETNRTRGIEILDREKEMVKLGAGVFRTHELSLPAFERGLQVIRKYVKLADSYNVEAILAVATSATREARNGGAFLDEIVRQTGIAPRVISGAEEARLIFLAVRHAINLGKEKALVIDIGGGSVELILGHQNGVEFGESLKLGVQRLRDMVPGDGPLSSDARTVLEAHIQAIAESILQQARQMGFHRVIGTSGTIRALGEAALKLHGAPAVISVNAETVHIKELKKLVSRLIKLKPAERSKIPAISPERTDTIHLGGILVMQLLKLAKVEQLTLCDASLREGVILDYIHRHPDELLSHPSISNVRHRSVLQLARKFDRDLQRENHIASLALQIFDQTISLHGLGDAERAILHYAALLHGIGQYISFQQYHKHSRYILSHANLRGFTDEEIQLLGLVVRFHRKSEPAKGQDDLKALSRNQRQTVAVLSGILRIAVGLDRGQNQLVKNIRCQIEDKTLQIDIGGPGDLELEIWGARRNRIPLANALGINIKFVQ